MRALALIPLFIAMSAQAQNAAPSWLENTLYSSGKMNTVLIVVTAIILGIAIWMFTMDRRIKRMEEKIGRSDSQREHEVDQPFDSAQGGRQ